MNKDIFNEFPIIHTKRLTLQEVKKEDALSLFQIYKDPIVAKYDWFYPFSTLKQAENLIDQFHLYYEQQLEITWAMVTKETNDVIGTIGFGEFDESANWCEIGYQLKQSEWNKGYMTEAVQALIEFGFNTFDFNRIEALVTPGNDASIKVLEKNKFIKEGLVRERDLIKGELVDSLIYSILKRDYNKQK